jgi:hypothetical protein
MDVMRHDDYREICAAASIGQATAEELFELEKHVAQCESCRQKYFDYLSLAAQQYAIANQNPALCSNEAKQSLNSELFIRRFFARAEQEGMRFSADVDQEIRQLSPIPLMRPRRIPWGLAARAVAAVVLFGCALSAGYFYGRRSFHRGGADLRPQNRNDVGSAITALDRERRMTELTATNERLKVEAEHLKFAMGRASERLRITENDLKAGSEDREALEVNRAALEAQLKAAQEALAQSQALAASAQQQATQQRDRASNLQAVQVESNIEINDLIEELAKKSAVLDQDRRLLALNHDVTDLMGARNLHIVDVVDTDQRGKTRPAFGRIFFTEGKSLVFYAYDLNETKIQRARYEYRVWARQEGGDERVRSLGIFYSDDKAQRRWVFKCNDPRILREIDSVFVTLEPANSNPTHPKGQNLMYAYLRGQPNHP